MTPNSPAANDDGFARAYAAHRAGRVDEAARGYLATLGAQPHHFDAMQLLGLLRHQQGRHAEALDWLRRALASDPMASHPSHAGAWLNTGHVLKALGRRDAAIDAYRKAVSTQPDFAQGHYNLGNALADAGQHAEATVHLGHAARLRPDDAGAHNNLGSALAAQGDAAGAAAAFRAALQLRPDYAGAHNNLGMVLNQLGQPDTALEHFRAALQHRADFVEALFNLGQTLDASGQPEQAIAPLQQAIALAPHFAGAHHALGNACAALGRHHDAAMQLLRAVTVDPSFALAYQNLGSARFAAGEYDAALSAFDDALRLRPGLAVATYNRALIALAHGDYTTGWRDYEARWGVWREAEQFDVPRWLGHFPLTGRTILLHAEQGFGDTLQFVRFVPMLAAQAGRVILAVQAPLLPLLAPAAQRWRVSLIAQGDARQSFDCHCPLLSLPLALGIGQRAIDETQPPYLEAPAAYRDKWSDLALTLAERRGGAARALSRRLLRSVDRTLRPARQGRPTLWIGIAWSGRVKPRGENRAIALATLAPLLALGGIDWFVLQTEINADDRRTLESLQQRLPRLHVPGAALGDFADTAALLEQLDGVVSIDTSVAHLAGALAKPLWLMLPYVADWRWLTAGATSNWYPSAQLFRQPHDGSGWDDVVARVRTALLDVLAGKSTAGPPG